MMASLRRAGLLRSSRGPRGGYRLARPAAAITLAEVLDCLEGDTTPSTEGGSSPERLVLQELAASLRQQRLARLQHTSLAQLLEQRDALQQAQAMYFI
jgi:Rrf2 family protein